jgi:hypothetical protein
VILAVAAVFTAGVCLTSTLNPGLRHPQWGPRFLMPVFPLLAAAVAYAFEHRGEWTRRLALPAGVLPAVLAVATVASLGVQVQGLRQLYRGKQQYERLLAAIDTLDRGELIVSDIWWFGAVGAPVLYEREAVAVNVDGTGSLSALLQRLEERGVVAFTFVTGSPLAEDETRALFNGGWSEASRRIVPLWFHARLLSYRRKLADNGSPV